jgi:hypothetical protein
MSTCHRYPTKAEAIEGFCDEFGGFCSVSATGVKSVPSDVEKTALLDNLSTNDYNDCDGGFDFDLACPSACGQPQTTKSATYKVVADAFGEGAKECPYHDGFVMNVTCPATEPCAVPCEGSWTSPPCPTACGTPASTPSKTWTMTTPAQNGGSCPNTGPAPTYSCPATPSCSTDCEGGNWDQYASGFPPCNTECSYPGKTYTRNWVGATPATGDGQACPDSDTKTCPAQTMCSKRLYSSAGLTFKSGLPEPDGHIPNGWSVVDVGGGQSAWQWTSEYDNYNTYKLDSYKLRVYHRYEYSWFPIRWRMLDGSDYVLHEFDLGAVGRRPYDYMYSTDYKGQSFSVSSGYYATCEYVDTSGTDDWEMRVSCTGHPQVRQIKFQIFYIQGRNNCTFFGSGCRTVYSISCDAS